MYFEGVSHEYTDGGGGVLSLNWGVCTHLGQGGGVKVSLAAAENPVRSQ